MCVLNVESFQTGFTALHVAAQFGQIDFVREMLAKVLATVRSEAPHAGDVATRELGPEVLVKFLFVKRTIFYIM